VKKIESGEPVRDRLPVADQVVVNDERHPDPDAEGVEFGEDLPGCPDPAPAAEGDDDVEELTLERPAARTGCQAADAYRCWSIANASYVRVLGSMISR
jgi:hypothetical protein